jgi:putative membrane protein
MDFYKEFREDMIFRDHLALDRTQLANERTLLAFIRTFLACFAAGIGFIKLWPSTMLIITGSVLVLLSLPILIIGVYRYNKMRQKLERKPTIEP